MSSPCVEIGKTVRRTVSIEKQPEISVAKRQEQIKPRIECQTDGNIIQIRTKTLFIIYTTLYCTFSDMQLQYMKGDRLLNIFLPLTADIYLHYKKQVLFN